MIMIEMPSTGVANLINVVLQKLPMRFVVKHYVSIKLKLEKLNPLKSWSLVQLLQLNQSQPNPKISERVITGYQWSYLSAPPTASKTILKSVDRIHNQLLAHLTSLANTAFARFSYSYHIIGANSFSNCCARSGLSNLQVFQYQKMDSSGQVQKRRHFMEFYPS